MSEPKHSLGMIHSGINSPPSESDKNVDIKFSAHDAFLE